MKKTILSIIAVFALSFNFYAQVEASKAVNKANKALGAYIVNQEGNADKLAEALDLIQIATTDETTNKNHKTWQVAGNIYNELSNKDLIATTLDSSHDPENPDAPMKAFDAFKKSMEFAAKKFETKEALKGMQEASNHLANIGNVLLGKKNYTMAYDALNAILEVNKIQQENGMSVTLANDQEKNDHTFVTAYCAMAAEKLDIAEKMFAQLRASNYEDARIYSYGYKIASDKSAPDAYTILEKGAELYPDEQEILFAQINHFIKQERYTELTSLLEKAIEKSPDNPSVFSALGNVYMNLHQEEYAKGGAEADAYFAKSKEYYEQAVALDANLFDVQYSLGSLYFNKAVEISKKMGDLPLNETKKYDMLKEESDGLFNIALPYFKIAEKLNANDTNTLIALKEIFARNDDFEKSNEFKARLDKVQNGGTNDSSYFK